MCVIDVLCTFKIQNVFEYLAERGRNSHLLRGKNEIDLRELATCVLLFRVQKRCTDKNRFSRAINFSVGVRSVISWKTLLWAWEKGLKQQAQPAPWCWPQWVRTDLERLPTLLRSNNFFVSPAFSLAFSFPASPLPSKTPLLMSTAAYECAFECRSFCGEFFRLVGAGRL